MSPLLRSPVCSVLGCRVPVVLAGMGGVSRSDLVAAVSAAGGLMPVLALIETEWLDSFRTSIGWSSPERGSTGNHAASDR